MEDLAVKIGELLRRQGLTLGIVESATGGLLSHLVTSVPGSSDYYQGSVTSYSNEIKIKIIGVKAATLEKYGSVSPQVAGEMAAGGRKLLDVDICLADTGIAGPGGVMPRKPVGLFYIGLATKDGVSSRRYEFHGDRGENQRSAAAAALGWLKECLEKPRNV
ncbi:MAG: damage-inducible protein CinA [Chloroflexi bacterium RBG_16_56_11]|nr:MAG: damage-inducible protein CinA [Chloroflexi bacterium RBG_16_56_11]